MKPIESRSFSNLYYRLCRFVLFFAVATSSFSGFYGGHQLYDSSFDNPHGSWTFESDVDGTDLRPFIYRQMLPATVNWIDSRFSDQFKDELYNLKGRTGLLVRNRIIDSPIARDRQYFLRYWMMYGLVFLFAWLSIYAMYWTGKAMGFPPVLAALTSIAMMVIMPYIQAGVGHAYDYPDLAFMMLAVLMALKLDWWWMIPLTALATFNRESYIFFVLCLIPLIRTRTSRTGTIVATSVLGLVSLAVNVALRLRFQNNPGSAIEYHFMDQIASLSMLVNPHYMVMKKTYGIWALPSYNLLTIALIAWTVWRVWPRLSHPIRRHIQIAAVINFPLYILFCEPGELRDLSLLFVTLLILIAASLTEWMGVSVESALRGSA